MKTKYNRDIQELILNRMVKNMLLKEKILEEIDSMPNNQ